MQRIFNLSFSKLSTSFWIHNPNPPPPQWVEILVWPQQGGEDYLGNKASGTGTRERPDPETGKLYKGNVCVIHTFSRINQLSRRGNCLHQDLTEPEGQIAFRSQEGYQELTGTVQPAVQDSE